MQNKLRSFSLTKENIFNICKYKLKCLDFHVFNPPTGLRKTMLRAHRQAWCWQDEYYGLQLSDIRRLERETQLALAEKMKMVSQNEEEGDDNGEEAQRTPKIPISTSFDQATAIKKQTPEHEASGKIMPMGRKMSSEALHKRSLSGSTKHRIGHG